MDRIPTGTGPDLAPPPTSSGVTGINVTPLIDVLLVLFVVFLVVIGYRRRTQPLAVPAGDTGGPTPVQILLDITASGNYRLNGQPIPGDMLSSILQVALRDRPAKVVFIRTAPERAYQDFITAAGIVRGAGASLVALVESN